MLDISYNLCWLMVHVGWDIAPSIDGLASIGAIVAFRNQRVLSIYCTIKILAIGPGRVRAVFRASCHGSLLSNKNGRDE